MKKKILLAAWVLFVLDMLIFSAAEANNPAATGYMALAAIGAGLVTFIVILTEVNNEGI
jgi:hypothetical protein